MNVVRTHNKVLIRAIVSTPDIRDRVCEDGFDFDAWEPNTDSDCWLLALEDDELVGVYLFVAKNRTTAEIHPHVLPEKRGKLSYTSCRKACEWVFNAGKQKIVAEIPVIYPEVKRFALKMGFSVEGLNRQSIQKKGELLDQWIVGLTKAEGETWAV